MNWKTGTFYNEYAKQDRVELTSDETDYTIRQIVDSEVGIQSEESDMSASVFDVTLEKSLELAKRVAELFVQIEEEAELARRIAALPKAETKPEFELSSEDLLTSRDL